MGNENPQPMQPGSGPDVPNSLDQALETPQATPEAGRGPDSHSLPRTTKPQVGTDWEARYKGLDARYQKDREQWTSELEGLKSQIQQLSTTPTEPSAPAQKPQANDKAPVSDSTSTLDALDRAIQQRKAASYRDMLVENMAKELGVPALEMFADDIPIHPPTLKSDGTIDDSRQLAAIKSFADKLRGVQDDVGKRTSDAIREGMTPGSSPGAQPTTGQDVYEEFLELMEVFGSPEFDQLSSVDQNRIQNRYFELTENAQVQDQHQGATQPTVSWKDMQNEVRDMMKRLNRLEGRGNSPYGNMA